MNIRKLAIVLAGAVLIGLLATGRWQSRSENHRSETVLEPSPAQAEPGSIPKPGARRVDSWQQNWSELKSQPEGVERDIRLIALLEEMARHKPLDAIALADGEPQEELRLKFLEAALRGWGSGDLLAAVAWANDQPLFDTGQAIASAFHGAAHDPEGLERTTTSLCATDTEHAGDYGLFLVGALNRSGHFSRAAQFAAAMPGERRTDTLNSAYSAWATHDPEAALKSAFRISDPATRQTAFEAAASRWAKTDPKAAAERALALESEAERSFVFAAALRKWSAENPGEAATWISRFEPSRDLDQAAAAIASHPDALREPSTALSWADSILNRQLKLRTLATVLNQWASADPVAAWNYANAVPCDSTEEQALLFSAFSSEFEPVSFLP